MGLAAEDCILARGNRDWERVLGACSTCCGSGGLATICTTQLSVSKSLLTLGHESPPLDFALPPLEVVWHGVPLGEFFFSFIALLPLLLMLLLMLSL